MGASPRMAVFVTWLLLVLLLQYREIDPDTLMELFFGRVRLASGLWSAQPTVTFLGSGVTDIARNWLFAVSFAAIDAWTGLSGVRFAYGALFSGALLLPFLLIRSAVTANSNAEQSPKLSWRSPLVSRQQWAIVAGIMLVAIPTLSNSSVRPQGVSLLCFSLLVGYVLWSERRSAENPGGAWVVRTALTAIILGLLWQNSHASLPVALVWLASRVIGHLWQGRCWQNLSSCILKWKGPGESAAIRLLFLLGIILFVLQFVTPDGFEILKIGVANTYISREVIQVTEWLPAWDQRVIAATAGFWFSLGVILSLFKGWRDVQRADLVSLFVMTVCAALSCRFILYWSVTVGYFLVRYGFPSAIGRDVGELSGERWRRIPALSRCASAFPWPLSGLGILLVCVVILGSNTFPRPFADSQVMAGIQLLQELRSDRGALRVYNTREWAGPIIYFLASDKIKVSHDGRLYRYTEREWVDYSQIARGRWDETVRQQFTEVDVAFLHVGVHAELIKNLTKEGWKSLFQQGDLSILLPP